MSEAWDLLAWWGTPTDEEVRNAAAGFAQPPTILAYGVTLKDHTLDAELVTVTRKVKTATRSVVLYREGEKKRVKVQWDDCLKPARWGGASWRLAE